MTARTALLIAIVVGLVVLLVALAQWALDISMERSRRQFLAHRTVTVPAFAVSGERTPPTPERRSGPLAPAPAVPAPPVVVRRIVTEKVPGPVRSYLDQVFATETERHRLWESWEQLQLPDSKTTPSDFLEEAERWDTVLRRGEIDSTCLAFHVAYEHFLAQEKAFLVQLARLQEQGDTEGATHLLEQERLLRPRRLARLQGRLREIQLAYPGLPEGSKHFHFN